MTLRIASTTLEAGESASWQPTAAFTVQAEVPANSTAILELHGRADASAPFKPLMEIKPADEPMIHCLKLFEVKLVWRRNTNSLPLQAWSGE